MEPINAEGLQLVRVSEDRVVLKRGLQEVLFEGPEVASVSEAVLQLADGTRSAAECVSAFPGPMRPIVEQVLQRLLRLRMLEPQTETNSSATLDREQEAFYWNFGPVAQKAPARLAATRVLVLGTNRISLAIVHSLLELGVGEVTLAGQRILDHLAPCAAELQRSQASADVRLRRLVEAPPPDDWMNYELICATSEWGEVDVLLESNRIALAARRPYLPVWFSDLVGYLGPLNIPFETPCFRCFGLRRDANDPHYEIGRIVRQQSSAQRTQKTGAGLLPPMARILGEVAALEIAKHLGGFVPSDTLGRVIELNLISFQGLVRRLLKVPRCPECSDLTFRNPKAITIGPQIPTET
jgi:bacteriocin biosynthesis cyclodehydratase domain-containing protein